MKQSCILQAEETALAEDAARVEPAHVASSYLAQAPESLKEARSVISSKKRFFFIIPRIPANNKQDVDQ
ncbi:hypothetical protein [Marinithermofilum abyssi]|nr:hypothetical protein [Marinithermofilum abyssi]